MFAFDLKKKKTTTTTCFVFRFVNTSSFDLRSRKLIIACVLTAGGSLPFRGAACPEQFVRDFPVAFLTHRWSTSTLECFASSFSTCLFLGCLLCLSMVLKVPRNWTGDRFFGIRRDKFRVLGRDTRSLAGFCAVHAVPFSTSPLCSSWSSLPESCASLACDEGPPVAAL